MAVRRQEKDKTNGAENKVSMREKSKCNLLS